MCMHVRLSSLTRLSVHLILALLLYAQCENLAPEIVYMSAQILLLASPVT